MRKNIVFLFVILLLSGCQVYTSNPIRGTIIDDKTRNPIEGAIIVATWELVGGVHNQYQGPLKITETTSGNDGTYTLPAWGPTVTSAGRVRASNPRIQVYKWGYRIRVFSNREYGSADTSISSQWNGKDLALEPDDPSSNEYLSHLGAQLMSSFHRVIRLDPCMWHSFPLLTQESLRVRSILEANNMSMSIPSAERMAIGGRCGNISDILKVHQ